MNTKQIEYFLAVAEELSFTRAAEKLYVSQTAVTQQIQSLEELIGVKLLNRTKKKVELTPAGQIFQIEGRQILESIENAFVHARAVSEGMTGGARLASPIMPETFLATACRNSAILIQVSRYILNPITLLFCWTG